jgi:hypothetical protein
MKSHFLTCFCLVFMLLLSACEDQPFLKYSGEVIAADSSLMQKRCAAFLRSLIPNIDETRKPVLQSMNLLGDKLEHGLVFEQFGLREPYLTELDTSLSQVGLMLLKNGSRITLIHEWTSKYPLASISKKHVENFKVLYKLMKELRAYLPGFDEFRDKDHFMEFSAKYKEFGKEAHTYLELFDQWMDAYEAICKTNDLTPNHYR